MKISFIAENDWANVLTEYSYCLNKHSDFESKSICLNKHIFNYNIQHDYDLSICSEKQKKEAQQFLQESDVIIFGEEGVIEPINYKILEIYKQILGIDLINSNKKLLIWHPGTNYRNNYNYYNNHPLRSKIYKHLYAIDLYRLSDKKENDSPLLPYQYFNFNYDVFVSNFKEKLKIKPWTILHIPSNPNTKGTIEIKNIINKLNLNSSLYNFKCLTEIPYQQVIKEKEKSIFYIDQYNSSVGGYGIASLEALFNSNLTFSTVNNSVESIQKLNKDTEIGIIPLGEDIQTLYETLNYFLNVTSEEELVEYTKAIGKWVEQYYSTQNIIKFFKNLLK
jgi:hypothetical protein